MCQKSRLSLDKRSIGGLTSVSVLQMFVTSMGAHPFEAGTSLEVFVISGFADQVTDFFADVFAFLRF